MFYNRFVMKLSKKLYKRKEIKKICSFLELSRKVEKYQNKTPDGYFYPSDDEFVLKMEKSGLTQCFASLRSVPFGTLEENNDIFDNFGS